MLKERINNAFNFISIFLIVSYSYLRMLGMDGKTWIFCYIIFLSMFALIRFSKIKLKKKEIIKLMFFVIIGLYSAFIIQSMDLLIAIIGAIGFLKYDSKEFIKKFLISSVICYVSIIVLYLLKIIPDNPLVSIRNGEIITRVSLGFGHVNQVFLYLLPIQLCLYALYGNNKKLISVLIFITSTILYIFSGCRTGYYTSIIFLIICNFPRIMKYKITNKIMVFLFLIFTILSVVICTKYGANGANKINEILSLRPYYINQYLEQYDLITLKGGYFNREIPLENMYIYL